MNEQEVKRLLEIEKKFQKVQERSKKYSERARVKQLLLSKKALESGIEVTESEIDHYLKNVKKSKK